MVALLVAGQATGIKELTAAATGVAWSELGFLGLGAWILACNSSRSWAPVVPTASDLPESEQNLEVAEAPSRAPSALAEIKPNPTPSPPSIPALSSLIPTRKRSAPISPPTCRALDRGIQI